MAATTMVHICIDEALKVQAAQTLASMGLAVSDASRVFLTRVVADKELPFATEAPNAASLAAMAEAREIIESRHVCSATSDALMDDLEKNTRK